MAEVADLYPTLSTKAAVYSGIISTEIPNIVAYCETANCSWPLIPTLGACGECTMIPTVPDCNKTTNMCTYSTTSGTSVQNLLDSAERSTFRVAPSNGSFHQINSTSRAYFSVFDLISVTQSTDMGTIASASECALWFCLQAHRIIVNNGILNNTVVLNHSTTSLALTNSAHGGEHVFVGIPKSLNTDNSTRYAVTHEAMLALRNFMTSITQGTATTTLNTLDSSSDWVEAMWNATTGDLSQWIDNFAFSLTSEFRLHGSVSSTSKKRYDGSATQMTPVVKVHWMWMLYPGFMIMLSLYFLGHTIIASSRDGICGWKGGVLPLLFCAVDEGIYARGQGGMEVPGGLEERIGGIKVEMFRDMEGDGGVEGEGEAEGGVEGGGGGNVVGRWGFRAVEDDGEGGYRGRMESRGLDLGGKGEK